MKKLILAAAAALLLAAPAASANDPFHYDTVRPGSRFLLDSINPGRDFTTGGSLSGPGHAGRGGPLSDTEGPGVSAEPRGGYTGYESQIDCGPGARYLDIVTGERLRRAAPMACGR